MGPRIRPPLVRVATRGFTMVELLIVLVIVAILVSMAAVLTRGIGAAQKRSVTATRMAALDAALVQFVMQNRRLPCPADGRIATGMPNAGVEARDVGTGLCTLPGAGLQQHGVAPWVSLGVGEGDATDGWDRRLTYRVHFTLVANNIMDMSQCDPAGSAEPVAATGACVSPCSAGNVSLCTQPSKYLGPTSAPNPPNKGLAIQNVVGGALMTPPATGAAYVLISHGESGGGAYLGSGTLTTSSTTDGLEEAKNYANLAVQPYYLDDAISDVAGANHFDDLVSRPSVLTVITKAALGPRSH